MAKQKLKSDAIIAIAEARSRIGPCRLTGQDRVEYENIVRMYADGKLDLKSHGTKTAVDWIMANLPVRMNPRALANQLRLDIEKALNEKNTKP